MRKIEIKTTREWRTFTGEIAEEGQLVATVTVDAEAGENFEAAKTLVRSGWTRLDGNDVVLKRPRPMLDSMDRTKSYTIPAGKKLFGMIVKPPFKDFVNERVIFDGLNNRLFGEFVVGAEPVPVVDE